MEVHSFLMCSLTDLMEHPQHEVVIVLVYVAFFIDPAKPILLHLLHYQLTVFNNLGDLDSGIPSGLSDFGGGSVFFPHQDLSQMQGRSP